MNVLELESIGFAAGLFVAMLVMLEAGRRMGVRHRKRLAEGASAGIGAVEAAVYALLGLLIAFTFQGAAARFDTRRTLIVEEANAIGTAWLRLDLVPAAGQAALRESFRQYLDSRLATYGQVGDVAAVRAEWERSQRLQQEIWAQAMAAEAAAGMKVTSGLLPSLNAMFDLATTRMVATKTHPPQIMFLLLAFLACASALLAGHGMSGSPVRSWLHIVGYAAVLALTVYLILDMEFPRMGFIRVDAFDQVLVELRRSMD
jgi:hypothetical protein